MTCLPSSRSRSRLGTFVSCSPPPLACFRTLSSSTWNLTTWFRPLPTRLSPSEGNQISLSKLLTCLHTCFLSIHLQCLSLLSFSRLSSSSALLLFFLFFPSSSFFSFSFFFSSSLHTPLPLLLLPSLPLLSSSILSNIPLHPSALQEGFFGLWPASHPAALSEDSTTHPSSAS